ncbi:LOW QUALITY PROTEIN: uncharacterized protein LOC110657275 [Hevea brasiliensis]|uniref:LOW QUALITY PROTEIN: uncharacterized protein LOC110657275 n=1 Tax=Hevea brasiliensis TaxID=3981 RepID=UPI0025CEF79C|nr:LOW QUALITY PROTEIN: uncharacterized protein LOC110657275 [Hevea brasiliensis]
MATKTKDGNSALKKEKKVTSSSNSHNIHKQANNPKPATGSSTDKDKSTPSSKPVPNYLKPTFSSRSESLNLVGKTINEDATPKLLRGRSFDRPSSAARAQKSLISPDHKERLASRDRPMAIQSSSFSASSRTRTSTKPALERSFRSLKPIRSQASGAGVIKRSSSFSRVSNLSKNGSNPNAPHSSKVPNSRHSTEALSLETGQERYEEFMVQEPRDGKCWKEGRRRCCKIIRLKIVKIRELSLVKFPHFYPRRQHRLRIIKVNYMKIMKTKINIEGEENHRSNNHSEEGNADDAKVESDEDKGEEENAKEKAACSEEPVDEKKKEDIDQGNENERSKELKSK